MKKLIGILLLILSANAQATTYRNESSFGYIDFITWQVRESGADNWAQNFNKGSPHTNIQLIDAPFDWNTGIRIGIGQEFNQHSFDGLLTFTHYQAYASNQATGTIASAFDGGYFVNNTNGANLGLTYNNANARWQIFYNTLDLDLGKNFTLDSVLQLHPYVGLKAASINQTLYTNWLNPNIPTNFTTATENLRNNFFGLGPMIGIDTTWAIYISPAQSISLVGNIAGGLLCGHWSFNEYFANNNGIAITTYVSSVNGAAPVVTGLLGLQWSKPFTQSNINIRLGYEAQIWFNQLQFYSLSMGRANRPLSIQGSNLEFRYNF